MSTVVHSLAGFSILLVEDEYWIARELCEALQETGAEVVGPFPDVQLAIEAFNSRGEVDGAILDINLHGERVFPLADIIVRRGIPVMFATGYEADALPYRFQHVPICTKPTPAGDIVRAMAKMVGSSRAEDCVS